MNATRRPDLTSARGAAAWGIDLSRQERAMSEHPQTRERELAQATLRHAAHHCAGVAAAMVLDGHPVEARTWAEAYRLLTDRAERADRARVARLGVAA